jgi:hypothetical protein
VPLRPQLVGELLGTALRIARRNLAVLAPVAVLVSVLGIGLNYAVLALTGTVEEFLDPNARWLQDALAGRADGTVWNLVAASLASGLVTTTGAVVLAGLAAPLVARAAVGAPAAGALRERLAGRWLVLVGLAVLTAIALLVGFALFIVPGILLYLAWFVAGPALVLERGTPTQAWRRSVVLTAGHRGRLFGIAVLTVLISTAASVIVSSLVNAVVGASGVTAVVVAEVVGALVSAVIQCWIACVVAIAYVDLRIRREGLAPALAAQARQVKVSPPASPPGAGPNRPAAE